MTAAGRNEVAFSGVTRCMPELLSILAAAEPDERDAIVRRHLGLPDVPTNAPGDELVGYHPSGIAAIARALLEAPVTAHDTFVDLGSGLGAVVLLTHLFTGATARGVEIQDDLVQQARSIASRVGSPCTFVLGDARTVPDDVLDDGTVFYLYLPFTGSVLRDVLERLRAVASKRAIIVATLGVDLERESDWLVRRQLDAFWLAIYDSTIAGAEPRRREAPPPPLTNILQTLAFERALSERQ